MSFNVNWPRWIKASIQAYFEANKGQYKIFYEGQQRDTNKYKTWIESRTNGPDIFETTKDFFRLYIDVSLICSCNIESDVYKIDRMTGDVAALLVSSIAVFDDTPDQIGCLIQVNQGGKNILIKNYGQIDQTNKLVEATVSARYLVEFP